MKPVGGLRRAAGGSSRCGAALILLGAWTPGAAALRDVAATGVVPQVGDHTLLSWREGPPYFTTARYSPERRFLRLETGHFAVEFDTERIALTGFARWSSPRDEASATQSALAAEPLPPAQLHLIIRVGETVYACTGRKVLALDASGLPASPLEFPVRVIESGRFFQKFALHDLEFHDPSGRRLSAAARLEVASWPDRLALTLVVRPEAGLESVRALVRLQSAGGMDASLSETPATWAATSEHRATLVLAADGAARAPVAPAGVVVRVAPADPLGRAVVRWNPEEMNHAVRLEAPPWPAPAEGIYPESKLDAWEAYDLIVENRSPVAQRVAINFEHTPVKAITGFVPMLVDRQDQPTGIPVQISKNWHQVRRGAELPYAGPWIHGRTWLNLPPDTQVTLRYGTTFARWGGLPTASLAQLSVIGYGHNGFWDQLALGSFGESICFQPGRVMRRALLTDFRPLFQRGMAREERWAWSSNVGGADTMVRLDAQGRYVPFRRNVTRYASHGPNLADLIYDEVSSDGAVHGRVELFLPQTDDGVRVYLRIHYDGLRHAAFSRLALFQLGADYYDDADSPLIAWGDAGGLGAEHRPKPETGARLLPAWEGRGEAPWISLHGNTRADRDRSGQASRGLVVRAWDAVLGGRAVPAPWFAAVGHRSGRARLAAEITVPPGVTALEPGDRIDLLVELLAFSLAADRYYGPDGEFRAALASDANTWRMVHREAGANRPVLQLPDGTEVRGWPLTVPIGEAREVGFTLRGGLGWLPVRLTGLPRADTAELWRVTPGGRERVVQGDPARAYWQCDYDVATRRWSVTYNLPAPAQPTAYVARVRDGTVISTPARP